MSESTINIQLRKNNNDIESVSMSVCEGECPSGFPNNCLPASIRDAIVCLLIDLYNQKVDETIRNNLQRRIEFFDHPQKIRAAVYQLMYTFKPFVFPDGTTVQLEPEIQKRLIWIYTSQEDGYEEYAKEIQHIRGGPHQDFMDFYQAAVICYYLFGCSLQVYTRNANYQEHDSCSEKYHLSEDPVKSLFHGTGLTPKETTAIPIRLFGTIFNPYFKPNYSVNHFSYLREFPSPSFKSILPGDESRLLIAGIQILFCPINSEEEEDRVQQGIVRIVSSLCITIQTSNEKFHAIKRSDASKWLIKGSSLLDSNKEFAWNTTLQDLYWIEGRIPYDKLNLLDPTIPCYEKSSLISVYTKSIYHYKLIIEQMRQSVYKKIWITMQGDLFITAGDIINILDCPDMSIITPWYIEKCDTRNNLLQVKILKSLTTKQKAYFRSNPDIFWPALRLNNSETFLIKMDQISRLRFDMDWFLCPARLPWKQDPSKLEDVIFIPGECPVESYNLVNNVQMRLCNDVIRFAEESYLDLLKKRDPQRFHFNKETEYNPSLRTSLYDTVYTWLTSLNTRRERQRQLRIVIPTIAAATPSSNTPSPSPTMASIVASVKQPVEFTNSFSKFAKWSNKKRKAYTRRDEQMKQEARVTKQPFKPAIVVSEPEEIPTLATPLSFGEEEEENDSTLEIQDITYGDQDDLPFPLSQPSHYYDAIQTKNELQQEISLSQVIPVEVSYDLGDI
jgi:hypothetical protein